MFHIFLGIVMAVGFFAGMLWAWDRSSKKMAEQQKKGFEKATKQILTWKDEYEQNKKG